MFCPNCEAEYKDHVETCVDCQLPLVSEDNQELQTKQKTKTDDLELVQIFSTQDPMLVALAKSLLDEAHIPAMVRNEGLQDLFGFGRLTFNPVSGDVDFFVNAEDQAAALELMAPITTEPSS